MPPKIWEDKQLNETNGIMRDSDLSNILLKMYIYNNLSIFFHILPQKFPVPEQDI